MTKNAFYFMTKARFVLEIFTFNINIYISKGPDKKPWGDFKICDVTDWSTDNYNTHITQSISEEVEAMKRNLIS